MHVPVLVAENLEVTWSHVISQARDQVRALVQDCAEDGADSSQGSNHAGRGGTALSARVFPPRLLHCLLPHCVATLPIGPPRVMEPGL